MENLVEETSPDQPASIEPKLQISPKRKIFTNRKIILLIVSIFVFFIMILAVGFMFLKQDKVLTTVGALELKQSDVERLKEERFSDSSQISNNKKVEEVLLDELVKEQLIRQEADKRGITVTTEELENAISSYNVKTEAIRRLTYNSLLLEKVKNAVVSWREIDYLFVYKETALEEYDVLASKAKSSMEKVRKSFLPTSTLKAAFDKEATTVNFDTNITVTENKKTFFEDFDISIAKSLFETKEGELTDVIDSGSGTFIVAHIKKVNDTGYLSLEDWFTATHKLVEK